MTTRSAKESLLSVFIAVAIAVGFLFLPQNAAIRIRTSVRDAILPGHRLVAVVEEKFVSLANRWIQKDTTVTDEKRLSEMHAKQELELRRLRLENARLQKRLASQNHLGVSPYRANDTAPLLVEEMIQARVFGEELSALWKTGWLLDKGSREGVGESDLVLRDEGPLLDQGADSRLETGFPVFAGRTVYGRILHVGKWTSSVQRVTDRGYRSHAQIVRKTGAGYIFGALGVLQGTGDSLCRLELVSSESPVKVGDEVYTASEAGRFPFPMYYGKIVRAQLSPGAAHWEIDVQPVIGKTPPEAVQILRRRINPLRNSSSGNTNMISNNTHIHSGTP
ncbi:MAG: hypothetical protein Tsb009_10350 [Planctomycetaceae bacterium]